MMIFVPEFLYVTLWNSQLLTNWIFPSIFKFPIFRFEGPCKMFLEISFCLFVCFSFGFGCEACGILDLWPGVLTTGPPGNSQDSEDFVSVVNKGPPKHFVWLCRPQRDWKPFSASFCGKTMCSILCCNTNDHHEAQWLASISLSYRVGLDFQVCLCCVSYSSAQFQQFISCTLCLPFILSSTRYRAISVWVLCKH